MLDFDDDFDDYDYATADLEDELPNDEPDESDWRNIFIEDFGWYSLLCSDILAYTTRRYILRHLVTWFWAWKITGPLYRLRHNIMRRFKRCAVCGKRGCGPYWFCNTCSDACSRAQYAQRVTNSKKWHLRKDDHYTLCGEWIWLQIKVGILTEDVDRNEFCSRCLKESQKHAPRPRTFRSLARREGK